MSHLRTCPSTSATNSSLSGNEGSTAAKNHQTVRWCTGLSGESEPPRPTIVCMINERHVAKPTFGWSHQTVSSAPTDPKIQRSALPDKERDRAPDCNRTCPVRHSTEGRNCLPSLSPTAPSCLGAIKGTPRRMKQNTKYSLSILRHPDSASTHLIDCVSDLSSV